MTQYSDRFYDHSVHAELSGLRESINAAELDLAAGEVRDGYDRFLRVVGFIERSLTNVDPELVTAKALTTLQNQIHSLRDHHEAFTQNQDPNALNNQADTVLGHLHLLPQIVDGAGDFSEALEELRSRLNEIIDALKARQTELDAERDTLAEQLQTLKVAIDQQDERFEAQKGRIDELITNQQAKFNEEQQQRNTQFNEALKTQETTAETVVEQFEEQSQTLLDEKEKAADTQLKQHDDQAQEKMDVLAGHLEHAKKIVGLIGNTGMTGHYQMVANRELKSANRLRIFALIFFVLMAVAVGWVVKEIKTEDFNWEVALFRVVVALTLLAPAYYCAIESTRHRRSENRNRRIELELASINPYLESLTEEKSQAVIERLADQYFGNETPDLDGSSGDFTDRMPSGELLKIVERIAKILHR